MFILPDGRPISPDVAFSLNDISYPANWLRLATPAEREAIGITEEPDPAVYDQRFYWGYDADGNLIPKDHTELVTLWSNQTRTTAGTILLPSDWLVVRQADNGTAVPVEWKDWRETIRLETGTKIAAIEATTTTDELAAYITGPDYPVWSPDPDQPLPPVEKEVTEEPA